MTGLPLQYRGRTEPPHTRPDKCHETDPAFDLYRRGQEGPNQSSPPLPLSPSLRKRIPLLRKSCSEPKAASRASINPRRQRSRHTYNARPRLSSTKQPKPALTSQASRKRTSLRAKTPIGPSRPKVASHTSFEPSTLAGTLRLPTSPLGTGSPDSPLDTPSSRTQSERYQQISKCQNLLPAVRTGLQTPLTSANAIPTALHEPSPISPLSNNDLSRQEERVSSYRAQRNISSAASTHQSKHSWPRPASTFPSRDNPIRFLPSTLATDGTQEVEYVDWALKFLGSDSSSSAGSPEQPSTPGFSFEMPPYLLPGRKSSTGPCIVIADSDDEGGNRISTRLRKRHEREAVIQEDDGMVFGDHDNLFPTIERDSSKALSGRISLHPHSSKRDSTLETQERSWLVQFKALNDQIQTPEPQPPRVGQRSTRDPSDEPQKTLYVVKQVIGVRYGGARGPEHLIEWLHWPHSRPEWVPVNRCYCSRLIDEFRVRYERDLSAASRGGNVDEEDRLLRLSEATGFELDNAVIPKIPRWKNIRRSPNGQYAARGASNTRLEIVREVTVACDVREGTAMPPAQRISAESPGGHCDTDGGGLVHICRNYSGADDQLAQDDDREDAPTADVRESLDDDVHDVNKKELSMSVRGGMAPSMSGAPTASWSQYVARMPTVSSGEHISSPDSRKKPSTARRRSQKLSHDLRSEDIARRPLQEAGPGHRRNEPRQNRHWQHRNHELEVREMILRRQEIVEDEKRVAALNKMISEEARLKKEKLERRRRKEEERLRQQAERKREEERLAEAEILLDAKYKAEKRRIKKEQKRLEGERNATKKVTRKAKEKRVSQEPNSQGRAEVGAEVTKSEELHRKNREENSHGENSEAAAAAQQSAELQRAQLKQNVAGQKFRLVQSSRLVGESFADYWIRIQPKLDATVRHYNKNQERLPESQTPAQQAPPAAPPSPIAPPSKRKRSKSTPENDAAIPTKRKRNERSAVAEVSKPDNVERPDARTWQPGCRWKAVNHKKIDHMFDSALEHARSRPVPAEPRPVSSSRWREPSTASISTSLTIARTKEREDLMRATPTNPMRREFADERSVDHCKRLLAAGSRNARRTQTGGNHRRKTTS